MLIALGGQSQVPQAAAEVKSARTAVRRSTVSREKRRREEQLKVIDDILKNVEEKLTGKDAKATLGDYIKLMQLQKELDEDEQPREIRVTWVDALVQITGEAINSVTNELGDDTPELGDDTPVDSVVVAGNAGEEADEGSEQ